MADTRPLTSRIRSSARRSFSELRSSAVFFKAPARDTSPAARSAVEKQTVMPDEAQQSSLGVKSSRLVTLG